MYHTAIYCNTVHYVATHRNTLQRTATYCNTLQHTVLSPSRSSCTLSPRAPFASSFCMHISSRSFAARAFKFCVSRCLVCGMFCVSPFRASESDATHTAHTFHARHARHARQAGSVCAGALLSKEQRERLNLNAGRILKSSICRV